MNGYCCPNSLLMKKMNLGFIYGGFAPELDPLGLGFLAAFVGSFQYSQAFCLSYSR